MRKFHMPCRSTMRCYRCLVWGGIALAICIAQASTVAAQPGSQRGAFAKPNWPRLFQRRNADDSAPPQSTAQNQPGELRVIDRATAQRRVASQDATPLRTNLADVSDMGEAQLVGFQEPAPRVYRTPPANPYAHEFNPHDPAYLYPNYGLPYGYGHPVAPPQPLSRPFTETLPPDQSSAESGHYSSQPPIPPHDPSQWYSQPDEIPIPQLAESSMGGQGYLRHGTTFQGRRLSNQPITATERALELLEENQRLRDALARSQAELQRRDEEMAQLRDLNNKSAAELSAALDHIQELKQQIARLANNLNLAIEDRNRIEQRAHEQLSAIETMLDGILMETLSPHKR